MAAKSTTELLLEADIVRNVYPPFKRGKCWILTIQGSEQYFKSKKRAFEVYNELKKV